MTTHSSPDWLPIQAASRSLGVHISTVREWADAGLIRSYRTAGGHRRFSRIDLQNFLNQHQKSSQSKTNPAEQTLTRVRQELHALPHSDWLKSATVRSSDQARAHQREFGQRLLSCVVTFVEEPSERARLLEEGSRVAHDYGRVLMESGLSAGSAARATIHFRQLVLKSVLDAYLGSRTGDEEDTHLFQRVSAFIDDILFAIIEAYP